MYYRMYTDVAMLMCANAQGHIKAAAWHPTKQLLALCTGGGRIFMWSPQGCRTAPLPAAHELKVSRLTVEPSSMPISMSTPMCAYDGVHAH